MFVRGVLTGNRQTNYVGSGYTGYRNLYSTPCSRVGGYKFCGGVYCFSLQGRQTQAKVETCRFTQDVWEGKELIKFCKQNVGSLFYLATIAFHFLSARLLF